MFLMLIYIYVFICFNCFCKFNKILTLKVKKMNEKTDKFDEKKVFVGNLPLGTLEIEVESFLKNLVNINIEIGNTFLLCNKKSLSLKRTISAIVTLESNFQRDYVINTFKRKYLNGRCHFKSKNGNETAIYTSFCYPKPNSKQLAINELNNNSCSKESKDSNALENPQITVIDISNKDTESNTGDNETHTDKDKLLKDIDLFENLLKEKCPEFYVSSKELALLQKEYDDLSQSLETRKKDLVLKHTEFADVYELFEQLNC